MNGKTAKILRSFSTHLGVPEKDVKSAFKRIPKSERGKKLKTYAFLSTVEIGKLDMGMVKDAVGDLA